MHEEFFLRDVERAFFRKSVWIVQQVLYNVTYTVFV
jgi:hypothetical protein